MNNQPYMYVIEHFQRTIAEFQQLALRELIQQLIVALRKYYQFEAILEALAEYTKGRDDWAQVTQHIQAARLAVLEASARLRGGEVDEDDENSNI